MFFNEALLGMSSLPMSAGGSLPAGPLAERRGDTIDGRRAAPLGEDINGRFRRLRGPEFVYGGESDSGAGKDPKSLKDAQSHDETISVDGSPGSSSRSELLICTRSFWGWVENESTQLRSCQAGAE